MVQNKYNIDFSSFKNEDEYKDLNLSLFTNVSGDKLDPLPVIFRTKGTFLSPEENKGATLKLCHPIIDTTINLTSTKLKLFDISKLFNDSLYYDIKIDLSSLKKINESNNLLTYLPLLGLGLKEGDISNSTESDETFWCNSDIKTIYDAKYIIDGSNPFEIIQSKVSSSDYLKWLLNILDYIQSNSFSTSIIESYDQLSDIQLSNKNIDVKELSNKIITGKINLNFVLPYVSGKMGSYQLDIDTNINFKSKLSLDLFFIKFSTPSGE